MCEIVSLQNYIQYYENELERIEKRMMQISKDVAKLSARRQEVDGYLDTAYLDLKELGIHEPVRLPRDINGDCRLPAENAEDGQGLPEEVPGQQPGAAGEPTQNAGELHRGNAGDG